MSERKPPDWFDESHPPDDKDADFRKRKHRLLEELPRMMERHRDRDRAHSFYPYLLVRSVTGDRGDRPINTCFWESPDIWTAPGDPSVSPALPPDHGGQVTVGRAHTVYAHVWNLGFAPLAGIVVEFYWFNPSLGISGPTANLIGIARCQLSGRGMPGSHQLVKCPKAWVPTLTNGGHECLVVRASGIGDPLGANEWLPFLNRHVAQRNISVVTAGADISHLVSQLHLTRPFNTKVQLIQLGAREGELARHIAVPRRRIANVQTQVLGELNVANEIGVPELRDMPRGAWASVHPMAAGGPPMPPLVPERGKLPIFDPTLLLRPLSPREPQARHPKRAHRKSEAHLADLFSKVGDLHPKVGRCVRPTEEEAHIVRLATYSGEQLVGGYTLVVT
jgi:hypothetical protein